MARTAQLMASKAHNLLRPRTPNEPWTDVFAQTAAGSTKLYIKPDRPPKLQRLNYARRKLNEVIKEHYPAAVAKFSTVAPTYHPDREPEIIGSYDLVPFLSIKAPTREGELEVVFDPSYNMQSCGINKAELTRLLRQATMPKRRVDTTQWCV